ncbi:MAG: TolC family protein [Nitrospiria bacterium]
MKRFKPVWTLLFLLASPVAASAESSPADVFFPDLWNRVEKQAPSEKAADFELKAVRTAQERAARQGYPRLYLDARAFSTNDPALSFLSVLNQRQIQTSDFSPDNLNNPGYAVYQKAALGLDWPLYDGGEKRSRMESRGKLVLAKTFAQKNNRAVLYQETAALFGSAVIFEEQATTLKKLLETTHRILGRYRIGVKSNPLGYSGLLGLKSLENKINETLIENDVRLNSAKNALDEKAAGLPPVWTPRVTRGSGGETATFVRVYLLSSRNNTKGGDSPQSEMLRAEAEAAEKQIAEEKAGQLPRVGLFSEAYLANGSRDTAGSYVLGLYLRWDFFSMDAYKKADQAEFASLALKAKREDFRLKEKIETQNAERAAAALEKEITLLTDTSRLLEEQALTVQKLFSNGSIQMLQFLDVLNRNLETALSLTDRELDYLNANLVRVKQTDFEIPVAAAGSLRNE